MRAVDIRHSSMDIRTVCRFAGAYSDALPCWFRLGEAHLAASMRVGGVAGRAGSRHRFENSIEAVENKDSSSFVFHRPLPCGYLAVRRGCTISDQVRSGVIESMEIPMYRQLSPSPGKREFLIGSSQRRPKSRAHCLWHFLKRRPRYCGAFAAISLYILLLHRAFTFGAAALICICWSSGVILGGKYLAWISLLKRRGPQGALDLRMRWAETSGADWSA